MFENFVVWTNEQESQIAGFVIVVLSILYLAALNAKENLITQHATDRGGLVAQCRALMSEREAQHHQYCNTLITANHEATRTLTAMITELTTKNKQWYTQIQTLTAQLDTAQQTITTLSNNLITAKAKEPDTTITTPGTNAAAAIKAVEAAAPTPDNILNEQAPTNQTTNGENAALTDFIITVPEPPAAVIELPSRSHENNSILTSLEDSNVSSNIKIEPTIIKETPKKHPPVNFIPYKPPRRSL